ncbi:MAG TPA: hypothetical protein VK501_08180 [Baekduia sp.]|uniref:hypothetical protein n=1 Tax=Baekduia sp. TaxID=2600305 RepID=UPI002CB21DBF|nr:hypothetical protein [Baekduia sp.]HMJ33880.1 hypothetical protein [Baekduia sp.]
MTEDNWVFVERFGGQMRRVTVLDATLHVVAMHERPDAPPEGVPDECELLRAVSLERLD